MEMKPKLIPSNTMQESKRTCEGLVADLIQVGLNTKKFTEKSLVKSVESLTGWSVIVLSDYIVGATQGVWIKNTRTETHKILLDSRLPSYRRSHVLYHEIGHLLNNDPTIEEDTLMSGSIEDICNFLAPQSYPLIAAYDIDRELDDYWLVCENRAEIFANLLESQIVNCDQKSKSISDLLEQLGLN